MWMHHLKCRANSYIKFFGFVIIFMLLTWTLRMDFLPEFRSSKFITVEETNSERKLSHRRQTGVAFFTEPPRNQSTVSLYASKWTEILPYYPSSTPIDGLWRPIFGYPPSHATSKGGFVYSAFLDDRFKPPFVRIVGMVPTNFTAKLFCEFREEGGDVSRTVEAMVEPIPPTSEDLFEGVFVKCLLPNGRNPNSVTIFATDSQGHITAEFLVQKTNLYIIKAQNGRKEGNRSSGNINRLTVCVRHLWKNYADVVQLIEFVEFHSFLGATDFHFYGHTYSTQVECLLRHYYGNQSYQHGLRVNFHNWEYPLVPDEEYFEVAPHPAMDDCLYRSITEGADFLVNADLDDFFVPRLMHRAGALAGTLMSLSQAYPQAAVFYFGRKQFPREFPDDVMYQSTVGQGLKLRILRKTQAQNRSDFNTVKVAVKPNRVTALATHLARDMENHTGGLHVDPEILLVHHYRMVDNFKAHKEHPEVDRSVHNFAVLLQKRILRRLSGYSRICGVTEHLWANDKP